MQESPLAALHPDAQLALFFETVEEIYARVFRELKPRTPIPVIAVEYCPFANANSSISWKSGKVNVKISDLLQGAPDSVSESLARILLGKLLRQPASAACVGPYRQYLNRKDMRRKLHLVRQVRGRKHLSDPAGRYFHLAEIFGRLNLKYFDGLLKEPRLGWSLRRSRTLLGHFDPSYYAIVISRIFDEKSVPVVALEYVMFHEMLHLKFPVDHSGARRCVHTRDFREAEKQFPQLAEAKEAIKRLA